MFPTAWAAVVLSAIITGLFLFILGKLRLARWVRFIPYPVIGGFLAGSGWLLVRGSFKVMVGVPLSWQELPRLLQFEAFSHWLVGLCFALVLLIVLKRYKHFALLPGLVFGTSALFLLGLRLVSLSVSEASARQWLFTPFPSDQLTKIWDVSVFSDVNWPVLLSQSGNFIVLMLVAVITILLNASSLEIATQTDVNLDRELQVCGLADFLAGCSGGMVGIISFKFRDLGQSFR